MADTITVTYDFTLPEVGGSDDTWGIKLNANWQKMETLLDSAFFSGSAASLGGALKLDGTSPLIWFRDSDAIAADRNYTIVANTGSLRFLKSDDAGVTISELAEASGAEFSITPPLRASGGLKLDGAQPVIWFHDSDALVADRNYTIAANTGSLRILKSDDAGASTDTLLEASALEVDLRPRTRLASIDGVAILGNAGSSLFAFQRTTVNYVQVPDGSSLLVRNASGTVWASVNSAAGWAPGSDLRMKDNVTDIGYGLDTVMLLRAVEFDWKDTGKHDIGLIAQEVQSIVPETVEELLAEEGEQSVFTLRKDALVAVLIKAIQELTARVAILEEGN